MRKTIIAVALLAAGGAVAQEAADPAGMSCGDFLALDPDAQMSAMLEMRTAYAGEDAPPEEEASAATKVTGATQEGAVGGMDEDEPVEAEEAREPAETRQRLAGVRTSCTGVPETPAMDAFIAAHADYDPEPSEPATSE